MFDSLDDVLRRYFGASIESYPGMCHSDVDKLLSDDAYRRITVGRLVASQWLGTEIAITSMTSEHLLVTHDGLLYAAQLHVTDQTVYVLATTPSLFAAVVDRVDAVHLHADSTAAVDCRVGHDLDFQWPLDAALRRLLDDNAVLRVA